MKNDSIIFIGATEFSARILKELILISPVPMLAAVTYSDIPHGRNGKLVPTPVKTFAMETKLPVIEVGNNILDSNIAKRILELSPSLGVLVAFRILPKEFISFFPKGIINLHPSLLPDLRGAAPVQRAIMLGYQESGLTTFLIDAKVDSGPIFLQEKFEIGKEETAGEVFLRIAPLSAKLISESVIGYLSGKLTPVEQVGSPTNLAQRITRKDRLIKWNSSVLSLHNRIRGLSPEPSALALFAGKNVKIIRTSSPQTGDFNGEPGEIIGVSEGKILVKCGDGALWITQIQPQGKSIMSGEEFARGYLSKSNKFEEIKE